MVCKIAMHKPLEKLRKIVRAPEQCHSSRPHCQLGYNQDQDRTTVLGIQGAAVGYCQGLLNKREGDTPEDHTIYFIDQLKSLRAPFYESHELLITQKPSDMSVEDYVRSAAKPLLVEGRVPILITDYDTNKDYSKIRNIFDFPSPIKNGESILVRMVVDSEASIDSAARLINEAVQTVKSEQRVPSWWPLLQSGRNFGVEEWSKLHDRVGSNWDYVTLAVHPFSTDILDNYKQNVIVAQWLVGRPKGMFPNGDVDLHTTNCMISNGSNQYNIYEFGQQLRESGLNPTSILCGGSLPNWTEEENRQRLRSYLPHFSDSVREIWNLNEGRTKALLSLAS